MPETKLTFSTDLSETINSISKAKGELIEGAEAVKTFKKELNSTDAKGITDTTKAVEQLNQQLVKERANLALLKQAYDNQANALKQNKDLTDQQKKSLEGSLQFSKEAVQTTELIVQSLEQQKRELVSLTEANEANNASMQETEDQAKKQAVGIQALRKEYRELVAASIAAAEAGDQALSDKLITQAGKVKDSIGDITQQTKNLGSDTFVFDSLSQGAQTAAAAFQVSAGFAALLGEENEDLQKTLVQLNAVMAITNGLQQVSNALQKESALRLAISRLATFGYAAAQKVLGQSTAGATTSLKSFNAALSGNALGLILVYVTTVISLRDQIVDLFEAPIKKAGVFGNILRGILAVILPGIYLFAKGVQLISSAFDSVTGAGQAMARSLNQINEDLIKSTNKRVEEESSAISRKYDLEIALASAAGRVTFEIEKEKQKAFLDTLRVQERAILQQLNNTRALQNALKSFNFNPNQALEDQLKETQNAIADSEAEITIIEAQAQADRRAKAKDYLDKRTESYKQAAAKIIELTQQASDAELDLLTGQDRIEALRERGRNELEEVKRQLQASNKVIAETSNDAALQVLVERGELTADQYELLRLLTVENEKKIADAQLALNRERRAAGIALMKEGTEKEIAQIRLDFDARIREYETMFGKESAQVQALIAQRDQAILDAETQGALKRLDTDQKLAEQELALMDLTGMSEIEKTRFVEEKKLQIVIDAARARLEILKAAAASDGIISSEEIAKIQEQEVIIKNALDGITKVQEDFIKNRGDVADQLLKAIFPNFTGAQLDAVKQAVQTAYTQIFDIVSATIDASIQANQTIIDNLNTQIEETQNSINTQVELSKQGLANNLDFEKENLKKLQDERKKALEEQKKLQKQKETLETVGQVISLISASANIFNSLSALGPIGIAIAAVTIGAMFAAFAAAKASAADAAGYREGVIDLQGPGTSKSDSIPAKLSKGESVMTAEETQEHMPLLKAMRSKSPTKMRDALIRELLKGTKVTMPINEVARAFSNKEQKVVVVSQVDKQLRSEVKLSNYYLNNINKSVSKSESITETDKHTIVRSRNKTKKISKR